MNLPLRAALAGLAWMGPAVSAPGPAALAWATPYPACLQGPSLAADDSAAVRSLLARQGYGLQPCGPSIRLRVELVRDTGAGSRLDLRLRDMGPDSVFWDKEIRAPAGGTAPAPDSGAAWAALFLGALQDGLESRSLPRLVLRARVPVRVSADGHPLGSTPLDLRLPAPGIYHISWYRPRYRGGDTAWAAGFGDRLELEPPMRPRPYPAAAWAWTSGGAFLAGLAALAWDWRARRDYLRATSGFDREFTRWEAAYASTWGGFGLALASGAAAFGCHRANVNLFGPDAP